jgi:gas vesicle protein
MTLQLSLNLIVMSKGKVLLGVLAGVAVGAALGVLFAPDKGWNTRKRIIKKGENITEDLRDKFEQMRLKKTFQTFQRNQNLNPGMQKRNLEQPPPEHGCDI